MFTPVSLERFVGPPLHREGGGGGVVIHEGTFSTDLVIPVHVHDTPVISLILPGIASVMTDMARARIDGARLKKTFGEPPAQYARSLKG